MTGDAPPDEPLPLIPWPRHVERRPGRFRLARRIAAPSRVHPRLSEPAWDLLRPLLSRCGTTVEVDEDLPQVRFERLTKPPAEGIADEAYGLDIEEDAIVLRATEPAGFLHAAQTLRQLLPVSCETPAAPPPGDASVPCLRVRDAPRLRWRGLHVDVARHVFPLDDLERFVDTLALHKCNVLHWHLTDDQGWRLEIDGWPRLTEVGGRREESPRRGARDQGDATPYAGWYTQAGARRLIAHAHARGIEVVPEIDLPGHMQAAIAAYPELGHGARPTVWTRWGVSKRVLNVEPGTVAFLQDVLRQVAEVFPGRYVHLGGDEVPTTEWEASPAAQKVMAANGYTTARQLQGWFVMQVTPTLREAGKRVILWDEALEFEAPADTTVMVWRDVAHGREAARRGHDVILCPESHCYLDHYQGDPEKEPEAIGGHTDLAKVLGYEPSDADWTEQERARLLGIQGNLWSEYIHDAAHLEYMAWPRGAALAERAWGSPASIDAGDFAARFRGHARRLKAMDVFFRDLDA